jgi:formate hydrogenlyase subunit 4
MNHEVILSAILYLLALLLAPFLLGLINRTKSWFGGRRGPPLLQLYYDLFRLLRKGVVYSQTTTWVFRFAPVAVLAALLLATAILPMAPGVPGLLAFKGDIFLLIYLLAAARFFTVLGALDTGSSFEGMGASREVLYAALAEPILLISLATLASPTATFSLSAIVFKPADLANAHWDPQLAIIAICLFIVLLVENCRIPFDDPNTHLELTMVHEVMVLDNSGPDLAFILYAAALKLWLLSGLVAHCLIGFMPLPDAAIPLAFVVAMAGIAILVGVIESAMARLRLLRVPYVLVGTAVLALVAFFATKG